MKKGQKMKAKSGFTLVEILIVVVILGILAAIVIPQFTDAAMEAKESRLRTELQTMRSQIELYKIQHNDELPGNVANSSYTAVTFTNAMTGQTNGNGEAGTDFGPYMQSLPTNPFNNFPTVAEAATSVTTATNLTGWWFNNVTGAFGANDDYDAAHVGW
jgi:general secretion pathway protein G